MSSFTKAPANRPEEIERTLSTLARYNPEAVQDLQEYVFTQCSSGSYDIMANLALLKLYQLNVERMREDIIQNVLAKSLTAFPEPDFAICLHLLPPAVLATYPSISGSSTFIPEAPPVDSDDQLINSVHRLTYLNTLLEMAAFPTFWSVLDSSVDEEYAELVADLVGFEDTIRRGITSAIVLSMRSIKIETALAWLNYNNNEKLNEWITSEMPGWVLEGDSIVYKQPEETTADSSSASALSNSTTGKVRLEQLTRVIKRVYENELLHH
ncbi:armadillo-type protein [Lipomyces oligophaga]|uniref:armadillo-type protein n=1 Tax=Lipomyces oligophaga TaxID=45792 RepID=UPI0034CDC4D8